MTPNELQDWEMELKLDRRRADPCPSQGYWMVAFAVILLLFTTLSLWSSEAICWKCGSFFDREQVAACPWCNEVNL